MEKKLDQITLQAQESNVEKKDVVTFKCSYCYLQLDKVLNCASCMSRKYCSKNCQRLDWKQHKIWCGCGVAQIDVDYEVRSSSFGMGVFAKRPFKVGDRILTERLVIRLPPNAFEDEKGLNEFKNQFASLPVSVKEAITDLYPQSPNSVFDRQLEIVGGEGVLQYKYNHFGLDSDYDYGCGLAITASRFNHRCAPNCGRFFIGDHNLLTIFVESPISEGEELTISYTSKHVQEGVEAFKKYMMSGWNFHCTCNVCKNTQLF